MDSTVQHGEAAECLLSVVAASRNDDHGGRLLVRMQAFVDGWIAQCRRHGLAAELILVDWNPPGDRPGLREALRWPERTEPCTIRIITVPASAHRALANSDALPLFQMIAKNAGLRRARGRYLLATNIDILFPDDTIRYLRDRLRPGRVYRAERCDVPPAVPGGSTVDEVLQFCRREMFRINARGRTLVRVNGQWTAQSHFAEHLLRQLARRWKDEAVRARGAVRRLLIARVYLPSRSAAARVSRGVRQPRLANALRFARRGIKAAGAFLVDGGRLLLACARTVVREARFLTLLGIRRWWDRSRPFTNACGDFTLMSREDWCRLRGYPEWEIFSWHLDSVLLYQACWSGLREVELGRRQCVYHIEHGPASGYTPEAADALFGRLKDKGIPYLTMEDFERIVEDMRCRRHEGGAIQFNKDDWGLAGLCLSDERIGDDGQSAGPEQRAARTPAHELDLV